MWARDRNVALTPPRVSATLGGRRSYADWGAAGPRQVCSTRYQSICLRWHEALVDVEVVHCAVDGRAVQECELGLFPSPFEITA